MSLVSFRREVLETVRREMKMLLELLVLVALVSGKLCELFFPSTGVDKSRRQFLLIIFFPRIPLTAISAGGDVACDATVTQTLPLFSEFNFNLTSTQAECEDQISVLNETQSSMTPDQLEISLGAVYDGCSNSFIGFLLEITDKMGDLLSIDSNNLLDIVTGGARVPASLPLKCIANELTSLFPNVMVADAKLNEKVYLVIHPEENQTP